MHGVVSLLDEQHYEQVEQLWSELESTFGVHDLRKTPFPHFSYHVAQHYDLNKLELILSSTAAAMQPFHVRTSGVALFTGEHPVLYVPVVRTSALSAYHRTIYEAVAQASAEDVGYYQPEQWVPHITLANGPALRPLLPDIMRLVSRRDFTWDVLVSNLALIYQTQTSSEVRLQFPFTPSM